MYVVPVATDGFLWRAVRAATDCGYAGLTVVLARSADARDQHEELTRDWTSLHDITGPLVAILCPDPQALDYQSRDYSAAVVDPVTGRAVRVPSLRLQHPSVNSRHAFDRQFWQGTSLGEPMWPKEDEYGFVAARAPRTSEDHHMAWTEATTRCAHYFGIEEEQMPAVLMLSLWERRAILIPLYPHVSIYRMAKMLIASLDDQPMLMKTAQSIAAELAVKLHELERQQRVWRAKRTQAEQSSDKWRLKFEALDRQLQNASDLNPALVARCREGVRLMLDSGHVGELVNNLQSLHAAVTGREFSYPIRHSAIWGLMTRLRVGTPLFAPQSAVDPHIKQVGLIQSALRNAESDLHACRMALQLGNATIDACDRFFGRVRTASYAGTHGLVGWELVLVEPLGRPPLTTSRRSG